MRLLILTTLLLHLHSIHASPIAVPNPIPLPSPEPVTDSSPDHYYSAPTPRPLENLVDARGSPCTPAPVPPDPQAPRPKQSMEPLPRRDLHPDDVIAPLDPARIDEVYESFVRNLTTQLGGSLEGNTVGDTPAANCYPRPPSSSGSSGAVQKDACKYLITEAFLDLWIFPTAVMSWAFTPHGASSSSTTPDASVNSLKRRAGGGGTQDGDVGIGIMKHLPADGLWSWNGCAVQVDNANRGSGEVGWFSLLDVAGAAVEVMENCVQSSEGQGGKGGGWGGTSKVVRRGQVMGGFYVSLSGDGVGQGKGVRETRVER